ncbi:caspase family protein [Gloeobacter morelensis]|uniref:Caspase family protein n=1 Tax=Gloeobacter morelensis MG652769 TaxID=2781736 RepID=A0ABY3PHJ4_9CYAN|nr:caspase family protein [Gloeobacter morelensis]UFP93146.1 caspase family protein [Gloeobacter morelensis MG652769]
MSPLALRVSSNGEASRFWMLLIGVNDYLDPGLADLRYCVADCEALARALQAVCCETISPLLFVHHDGTDAGASLERVRASLRQIVDAAGAEDTVLFYFSGHGLLHRGQAVLCLADTHLADLESTGLRFAELMAGFERCRAERQLVWLDACHSGGIALGGTEEQLADPTGPLVEALRQRAARSRCFYALLSCDRQQVSWAFPELGHGVFTHFLLKGLEGAAADAQGRIEADALYRYVYHRTLRYVDRLNQQQRLISQQRRGGAPLPEYRLQTPQKIVNVVGELLIGSIPGPAPGGPVGRALVVDGSVGSEAVLAFGRLLLGASGYRDQTQYWSPAHQGLSLREALSRALACNTSALPLQTVLIYLRGRIEASADGESWLVLREGICLSRSALRLELRRAAASRQIVVLDCPGAGNLEDWVGELRLEGDQSQCLIAAAAPLSDPDRFTRALVHTLEVSGDARSGLAVTEWIKLIDRELAPGGIQLHLWLAGSQGVIEVLPGCIGQNSTATVDLGVSPYKGLRPFQEADSAFFCGRDALVGKLVAAVRSQPFVAVIGASGSGKSSVVQAGLVAQLRQGRQVLGSEGWWIKILLPGSYPFAALARLLFEGRTSDEDEMELGVEDFVRRLRERPEPIALLVVDQFEELFTLAAAEERDRFIELLEGALRYAPDRFKLVITLRADSIAPCLEYPILAAALQRSSVLVPPRLSREDYRAVILEPAAKVGLQVEAELVEILLDELNHSAGDLPMLEFVLEQLWKRRTGSLLTRRAYEAEVGGLRGALECKAEEVYESLKEPEARECARWLMLNLVQLGEGTEDSRRRLPLTRLVSRCFSPKLVERVLNIFLKAKLLVVDAVEGEEPGSSTATVEVAHEVLIRSWGRLREWLADNRIRLRTQRQIEQAADHWQSKNRETDYLLRGSDLTEAEQLFLRDEDMLSPKETAFIEISLQLRAQQLQLERKRTHQLRRLAGVLALLTVVAMGFGITAYWQSLKSQEREIDALINSAQLRFTNHQHLEALVELMRAQSLVQQTWTSSLQLREKTRIALQQSVYSNRQINRLEGHSDFISQVSFSSSRKLMASASWDRTIRLWQLDGMPIKILKGHANNVTSVCFSPDGEFMASADDRGSIYLWTSKGELRSVIQGHNATIWSLRFLTG